MTDLISRAAAIAADPIETAPKDGTMLRLLVDYIDDGANPLEDEHQAWTIGFNNLENDGEDCWQFAGWSWEQDCFTAGYGRVLGWLPFHALPAAQVAVKPLVWTQGWGGEDEDVPRWHGIAADGFEYGFSAAGYGYATHDAAPVEWVAEQKAARERANVSRIRSALTTPTLTALGVM